jgi:hypothetical protein
VLFQGIAAVCEAVPHPGSAVRQVRQCCTLQTITGSFRILMASFCGVAIYTHPMSPSSVADILNIPNPSQTL